MFNGLAIENKIHNQKPLEILLFTSPFSLHSRLEQRLLETIKKRKLPIKITKIDVMRHPEIAEKHDVVACPTLIFRDFMRVSGFYGGEELEELISTFCFNF